MKKKKAAPAAEKTCEATIYWRRGKPTRNLRCVREVGHTLEKHLARDGDGVTVFEWDDPEVEITRVVEESEPT